ncbi:MAG: hypothetical protein WA866_27750, partial [Pseudolabrys sp.]
SYRVASPHWPIVQLDPNQNLIRARSYEQNCSRRIRFDLHSDPIARGKADMVRTSWNVRF